MFGKKCLLLAALVLGIGAWTPASFAKDGGLCKADVEKFCKDVEKGGGRIHRCLKQNKDLLSQPCQAKLEKSEAKRAACKADVEKFCKDTPKGKGAIRACMKSHESELSPQCKAAI